MSFSRCTWELKLLMLLKPKRKENWFLSGHFIIVILLNINQIANVFETKKEWNFGFCLATLDTIDPY